MWSGRFTQDILDLFEELDRHEVRWVLIGGMAVVYHGYARFTGDVDIFYDRSPDNAARLFGALRAFWGGDVPGVDKPEVLHEPGLVLQYGYPPYRVDLLNRLSGIAFAGVWERRVTDTITGGPSPIPVHVLSFGDLLEAKRRSGRPKDLEDIRFLTDPIGDGEE